MLKNYAFNAKSDSFFMSYREYAERERKKPEKERAFWKQEGVSSFPVQAIFLAMEHL